jgi:hypothetical protein
LRVNRNAAERAVAESGLSMAETLTMMMLLRRADNDTLIVPERFTPSQDTLAAEVRVSVRWLQLLLKHLGQHDWIKVVPGRGRGHKTTYALLPEKVKPPPCDCRKRRTAVHPSSREKANRETPFTAGKGELGQTEKAKSAHTEPQVSVVIPLRASKGEGVRGGDPRCTCGAPISHLRKAQAGPLCVLCESRAGVSADVTRDMSRDSHVTDSGRTA